MEYDSRAAASSIGSVLLWIVLALGLIALFAVINANVVPAR